MQSDLMSRRKNIRRRHPPCSYIPVCECDQIPWSSAVDPGVYVKLNTVSKNGRELAVTTERYSNRAIRVESNKILARPPKADQRPAVVRLYSDKRRINALLPGASVSKVLAPTAWGRSRPPRPPRPKSRGGFSYVSFLNQ